jgi:hypothetical protein
MTNPIKYSTGTETLALKKGNFYIGTGAVGKGPTSETGYYNGITPPTGGYTIYLNKESNGPSIYTASNNAELISLTNSIAGQSYTTVQQCFDYYYGQTDKVLVNQDYPADYPYIVMDGLVLNLDAGITQSYPGSGTTWTDVNGLGPKNNGTLINGPTFSGGSIVFDGVDDRVDCSSNNLSRGNSPFSVTAWVNTNLTTRELLFGLDDESHLDINAYQVNGTTISFHRFNSFVMYAPTGSFTTGEVQHVAWTYNGTTMNESNAKMYINGVLLTNYLFSYNAGPFNYDFNTNINNFISNKYTNYSIASQYTGNLYGLQLYNRALTDTEVLQNYNAQKGRFGL